MELNNLFNSLPDAAEEIFDVLCETDCVKIERIVSCGQATPQGEWYDQNRHEWVVLLSGRARLRFQAGDRMVEMKSGDHLLIPAHARHRVEWTDPDAKSVWLAVHFVQRSPT